MPLWKKSGGGLLLCSLSLFALHRPYSSQNTYAPLQHSHLWQGLGICYPPTPCVGRKIAPDRFTIFGSSADLTENIFTTPPRSVRDHRCTIMMELYLNKVRYWKGIETKVQASKMGILCFKFSWVLDRQQTWIRFFLIYYKNNPFVLRGGVWHQDWYGIISDTIPSPIISPVVDFNHPYVFTSP